MMELRNSKTTQLPNAPDGRRRFALDASIGALQMRGVGEQWQDIKPQLVKVGTKWLSQGTPYRIEIDGQGGRKIYPDRQDLTRYLNLPAIALFRNLPKRIEGNTIIASAPRFDVRFILTNSGIHFEVLIREPIAFDRITLDVDSVGLDILKLLAAKTGMGIPRPRLVDSTAPFPIERWLDWSYSAGQLELGFDLTGLKFPVLLKNTTLDLSVGASADDAATYDGATGWSLTTASAAWNYTGYVMESGIRFLLVTIPQAATIDVAYITYISAIAGSGAGPVVIYGDDEDNCSTFSTYANFSSRPRTSASVSYTVPAMSLGQSYNTSSLVSPVQEIINRALWVSGNALGFLTTANSANITGQYAHWDNTTYNPPAIHIEYSVAAGDTTVTPDVIALATTKYIPVNKWGIIPPTLAQTTTKYAPVMKMGIITGIASLATTKYVPVLGFGIISSILTQTTTKYAPVLKLGLIPSTTSLTTTKYSPVLGMGIITGLLSLGTTKYIPILKLGVIPGTLALNDTEYTPVLQLGIIPSTLNISTTKYIPILQFKITPELLSLILTEYVPTLRVGAYLTPSTLAIILSLLAPSLITKDSIIAETGRYGVNPVETYGIDMTKSGRYGTPPTTTWGDDITKSGRYGSKP